MQDVVTRTYSSLMALAPMQPPQCNLLLFFLIAANGEAQSPSVG